ncbi:MAG TPA: glycosyltransferase family 2 protein, partial [Candidatus Saccharibacteria bacterium]|nr:glycosyltransferase family 2 protein [Candidatus Saccharibacteria bacterium]
MIVMVIYGIAGLFSVLFAATVIAKLGYAKRHFKMKQLITTADTLEDLPSVTVCIPARNEMHAMAECLDKIIASTYPKMEIIVLDDSSEDNTSNLIKAYAHAGVRFVSGGDLPQGWLGKNYALNVLASKASGHYVLFLDVDIRVDKGSVGQLVSYMKQEKASMISVLPRRDDGMRASVIFSSLRYFWELL